MLTALTKHILEEGGKKLIIFDLLEHNIPDTLSRYARVSKSVSKKVDGLGLTTSLSTNIKLSHSSIRGLISLHNRRKSKSKKRKEKKKVEKDIRIKIGNSINIYKVESIDEIDLEEKSKQKVKFENNSVLTVSDVGLARTSSNVFTKNVLKIDVVHNM